MQYHFEGLKVWQKSLELVEEQYGLTGQMRRAAISIPANIAEGKGRGHKKEELQFLHIARGSVFELIALLRISKELGYLTESQAEELLNRSSEVSAMLNGLIQRLQ